MTPTQYQFLTQQLGELKATVEKIDSKLDAALTTQAEHAVKIRFVLWAGGILTSGVATVAAGLALAWVKATLHF